MSCLSLHFISAMFIKGLWLHFAQFVVKKGIWRWLDSSSLRTRSADKLIANSTTTNWEHIRFCQTHVELAFGRSENLSEFQPCTCERPAAFQTDIRTGFTPSRRRSFHFLVNHFKYFRPRMNHDMPAYLRLKLSSFRFYSFSNICSSNQFEGNA